MINYKRLFDFSLFLILMVFSFVLYPMKSRVFVKNESKYTILLTYDLQGESKPMNLVLVDGQTRMISLDAEKFKGLKFKVYGKIWGAMYKKEYSMNMPYFKETIPHVKGKDFLIIIPGGKAFGEITFRMISDRANVRNDLIDGKGNYITRTFFDDSDIVFYKGDPYRMSLKKATEIFIDSINKNNFDKIFPGLTRSKTWGSWFKNWISNNLSTWLQRKIVVPSDKMDDLRRYVLDLSDKYSESEAERSSKLLDLQWGIMYDEMIKGPSLSASDKLNIKRFVDAIRKSIKDFGAVEFGWEKI